MVFTPPLFEGGQFTTPTRYRRTALLFLTAGWILRSQSVPQFIVNDVGVLPGFSVSQATAISSSGIVTGYSSNPGFQLVGAESNGSSQGWTFANGVLTPMTPSGQTGTIPLGVNASGQVVGITGPPSLEYGASSFLYQNGKYTQPVNFPTSAVPVAINDAGQIPLLISPTESEQGVALWSADKETTLPLPFEGTFAIAYGMSGNGQVAGVVALGLNSGHVDQPAVWSNGKYATFTLASGVKQEIAFGVNNSGQAVGLINKGGSSEIGLYENGATTDLGAFDGLTYNIARAINNPGWVVGYGSTDLGPALGSNVIGLSDLQGFYVVEKGSGRAFLWINGTFFDLASLVTNNTGWEFDFAYAVNDAGQIVGTGFHNGVQTGFLLTPLLQKTATIVSAANPNTAGIAPGSLATAYGGDLAASVAGGTPLPLPTSFGGTSISILDSAGATSLVPLLYVSPTQVNFEVPPGVATGAAQATIISGDGTQSVANIQIAPVAPGLFELNSGALAAADVSIYHSDGTQTAEQVYTVNSAGAVVANPVSLGSSTDQAYLFLFGTGLAAAGTAGVTVSIGGTNAPVTYAGSQGGFAGLDQVNVQLPRSLAGSGNVTIQLTAAGIAANAVNITIQ